MAISIYSILKLSCLLLIFFIFLAGIYEFVENNESNGCEMTYMFEKMQYIVSIPSSHCLLLASILRLTLMSYNNTDSGKSHQS